MPIRYRKPNLSLLRAGGFARAVGEPVSSPCHTSAPRRIHRIAATRRGRHTSAEKELEKILNSLGSGALRGKFIREWAFKNWVLDFFLYEVRVGIEVDGEYHLTASQRERDRKKDADCRNAGITLVRLMNTEVFGNRDALIAKLRVAYREGLRLSRQKPK